MDFWFVHDYLAVGEKSTYEENSILVLDRNVCGRVYAFDSNRKLANFVPRQNVIEPVYVPKIGMLKYVQHFRVRGFRESNEMNVIRITHV